MTTASFPCLAIVVGLLGTIACGGTDIASGGTANYARSVNGTEGGYSMKHVHAKPPSLLVAQKIERPLYIVLDPARVRDTFGLETSACATASSGCEHFKLMDMGEFVRRDLKAAMEHYFSRVEVVASNATLPSTPHVVADVKIDDIKLQPLQRGMLTYELIHMTWSFALRESSKTEYSYSFAGTSESNDSYPTFEAGCTQLVENAIPSMLKKWTEGGGIEKLRGRQ
jgi:hypothetical protein